MGTTWEIEVWSADERGYAMREYWRGETLLAAIWNALQAKRAGYRCVRITRRPSQS